VNCAALPDSLLESELFGHVAGAFTDAKHDKPGRFMLANGGTLFLDEVGDISPALQVRLLRVLQERVVEPVGGITPEPVDVRVVAATNRNLAERMAAGSFREDLYYRIRVVHLTLPPLRERRADIPLLAEHFVDKFNQLQDRHLRGLDEGALAVLMAHDYPGNVRELANIIEQAFVLCRGEWIERAHLPPELRGDQSQIDRHSPLRLADMERALIAEALRRHNGNRKLAAQDLGVDPSTLYRKIRAAGLPTPATDGRGRRQ
jgi:transcriptional regulator with PAS, ATPase and Fis domain